MRISTYVRGDDSSSQTQLLTAWAKRSRHVIVHEFSEATTDVGPLGRELGRAVASLRGNIAALAVTRLRSIAEQVELQELVMWTVQSQGAQLRCLDERDSRQLIEPAGKRRAARDVVEVLGPCREWMSSVLFMSAKVAKANEDESFVVGPKPFGHSEAERLTVARIRALHAEGLSHHAIAKALDAEGMRARRGGRFHATSISRILRRTDGQ